MSDTHATVFKPSLESLFARLGPPHAGATLTADPLHQDLLQIRIVLAVDLILNLPAQAVRRTFVRHADSLEAEEAGRRSRKEGKCRRCRGEQKEVKKIDEYEWSGEVISRWSFTGVARPPSTASWEKVPHCSMLHQHAQGVELMDHE